MRLRSISAPVVALVEVAVATGKAEILGAISDAQDILLGGTGRVGERIRRSLCSYRQVVLARAAQPLRGSTQPDGGLVRARGRDEGIRLHLEPVGGDQL